jgi:hypothetical protein
MERKGLVVWVSRLFEQLNFDKILVFVGIGIAWLLFLFLSGHSLSSLEVAIVVSLLASVVFGYRDLRSGMLLTWATLVFFLLSAVFINVFNVVWVARNMEILAKSYFAIVIWFGMAVGRPFVLQYARRDLPKDQWTSPTLIQACRFLPLVWVWLISFSVVLAILRQGAWIALPDSIYSRSSLALVLIGLIVTTLFKRRKRIQRERREVHQ